MNISATTPFIALTIALSTALPSQAAQPVNGFAATVNGQVITIKEVEFHLRPIRAMLRAKHPRKGDLYQRELAGAQNEILEQLIENKLVLTELNRRGAALPDNVIDEEVKRIINENFDGSESKLRASLKERGMTMRGFKESQREQMLVQVFRQSQFRDVAPATPGEISKHYSKRKLKLRDRKQDSITFEKIFILATDPDNPEFGAEDQLNFAEQLAEQMKNGASFDDLAKQHAELKGAFFDKGEQSRLDLSPAFAEIIFEAPMNTVVGPLKDPAGFILARVTNKSYGPSPALSDVRERMRKEVELEKRSERYKKWIATLKRTAMIKRRI